MLIWDLLCIVHTVTEKVLKEIYRKLHVHIEYVCLFVWSGVL